jgi:predicted transcriptional regulator
MMGDREKKHLTRDMVNRYIADNPGPTIKMLLGIFQVNLSTLRYHLNYLQKKGEIYTKKKGKTLYYFSNLFSENQNSNNKNSRIAKYDERIFSLISNNPGISFNELKKSLKIRGKDLSYVLHKLKNNNQIWEVETSNGKSYIPVTRKEILQNMQILTIKEFLEGKIDEKTYLVLNEEIEEQIKIII